MTNPIQPTYSANELITSQGTYYVFMKANRLMLFKQTVAV